MSRPELGTKRLCANCGAKYYDFARTPIVCPSCNTLFTVVQRGRHAAAAAPAAAADEEEADAGPELVPLEEADADTAKVDTVDEVEADAEEAADPAADPFLEPEDEDEDDPAALLGGDIEGDEET